MRKSFLLLTLVLLTVLLIPNTSNAQMPGGSRPNAVAPAAPMIPAPVAPPAAPIIPAAIPTDTVAPPPSLPETVSPLPPQVPLDSVIGSCLQNVDCSTVKGSDCSKCCRAKFPFPEDTDPAYKYIVDEIINNKITECQNNSCLIPGH
jgi:hypothetical protein